MYYVYSLNLEIVLKIYAMIGYTNDLKTRFIKHQESKGRIELIYYEAHQT
jgi:predicted GIY-YIG superfamily endonuclease